MGNDISSSPPPVTSRERKLAAVRKADGQVRVTAQLIDALQDHHLWTERYDRPLKDIFALQDEIVQKIVTTLKLQLSLWEQGVLVRKTTDNLAAYDYYLRERESALHAWVETKKEANIQAQQLLEKAVELDPTYAEAYAALGLTYSNDWFLGWNRDFAQTVDRAFEVASKAVAIDDTLSRSHAILGFAYLWRKQYDQAIAEAQRAVTLDPNDANAYVNLAESLRFAGRSEEAIGLVEKAMRLNPQYPTWYLTSLGMNYRATGRYEEAVVPLKKAATLNPNFWVARANLAACYAELGRLEEARSEAMEVLRLAPNFSLEVLKQVLPYKDPAEVERFFASLRKAGLK
ncbi:MAG: tetratricopeptide repeat protein [Deltaproteobacteria bacterium]|nr:tetratricopeptide repeat protein [Deltaproteobacteria bacterium]